MHHSAGRQNPERTPARAAHRTSTCPTQPLLLVVQVNRKLAAQAMLDARKREAEDTEELEGEPSAKKRKPSGPSVLEDPRFQALFEDPSFAVDEEADEYKTLHPNAGRRLGGTAHFFSLSWQPDTSPSLSGRGRAGGESLLVGRPSRLAMLVAKAPSFAVVLAADKV